MGRLEALVLVAAASAQAWPALHRAAPWELVDNSSLQPGPGRARSLQDCGPLLTTALGSS